MSENKPFVLTDDPQPPRGSKYHLLLILFLSLIVVVLVFYFIGIFKVKEKIEIYTKTDSIVNSEFLDEGDTAFQAEPAVSPKDTLVGENRNQPVDTIFPLDKADQSTTPQTIKNQTVLPPATDPVVAQENKFPSMDQAPSSEESAPTDQAFQTQSHEYWYIIVNTFRGLYYAKKQVTSLNRLGYQAFYRSIKIKEGENQGIWYKVYVGPFNSKEDLNQTSSKIKQNQKQNQICAIRLKKLLN